MRMNLPSPCRVSLPAFPLTYFQVMWRGYNSIAANYERVQTPHSAYKALRIYNHFVFSIEEKAVSSTVIKWFIHESCVISLPSFLTWSFLSTRLANVAYRVGQYIHLTNTKSSAALTIVVRRACCATVHTVTLLFYNLSFSAAVSLRAKVTSWSSVRHLIKEPRDTYIDITNFHKRLKCGL